MIINGSLNATLSSVIINLTKLSRITKVFSVLENWHWVTLWQTQYLSIPEYECDLTVYVMKYLRVTRNGLESHPRGAKLVDLFYRDQYKFWHLFDKKLSLL